MTGKEPRALSALAAQHWKINLQVGFDEELRFIQRKYLPEEVWGDFEGLVMLELAKLAHSGGGAAGREILWRVQKRIQRERDKHGRLAGALHPGIEASLGHPADEIEKIEQMEQAIQAVQRILAPEEQALVKRHLMDGLTIREIAEETGYAASTIHRRIENALQRIRSAISIRDSGRRESG